MPTRDEAIIKDSPLSLRPANLIHLRAQNHRQTDAQKPMLSECAEIARRQAFMEFRFDAPHHRLHHHDRLLHRYHGPSLGELEHRYRRVCMLARGYQLAPLDDPAAE